MFPEGTSTDEEPDLPPPWADRVLCLEEDIAGLQARLQFLQEPGLTQGEDLVYPSEANDIHERENHHARSFPRSVAEGRERIRQAEASLRRAELAHCRAWRRVQRAAAELDAAEEECQGRAREVASAEDALQLEVQRFPEGPQEAPQSSRMFLPFGALLGDKELDFDMGDYLSAERVAELSAEDAEELERRKTAFL